MSVCHYVLHHFLHSTLFSSIFHLNKTWSRPRQKIQSFSSVRCTLYDNASKTWRIFFLIWATYIQMVISAFSRQWLPKFQKICDRPKTLEMSSYNKISMCVGGLAFAIMRASSRMTSDITNCTTFINVFIFLQSST